MGLSRWLQLLALAKLSREETPIKLETAAAAVQLPADEPIKLTTNTTTQTKNVSGPAFDALDVRAELLAPREGALLASHVSLGGVEGTLPRVASVRV